MSAMFNEFVLNLHPFTISLELLYMKSLLGFQPLLQRTQLSFNYVALQILDGSTGNSEAQVLEFKARSEWKMD